MFCRKCGKQIPDDSTFCPRCGAQNSVEAETGRAISLKKTEVRQKDAAVVQVTEMVCRNCGKELSTAWEHCPYCTVPNPFYIRPSSERYLSAPQPQVIIKEERVIVKEEKKEEEKGCGTILGEAIGGFLLISFLIGMLQSCGICAG